jgi:hypothetical protein
VQREHRRGPRGAQRHHRHHACSGGVTCTHTHTRSHRTCRRAHRPVLGGHVNSVRGALRSVSDERAVQHACRRTRTRHSCHAFAGVRDTLRLPCTHDPPRARTCRTTHVRGTHAPQPHCTALAHARTHRLGALGWQAAALLLLLLLLLRRRLLLQEPQQAARLHCGALIRIKPDGSHRAPRRLYAAKVLRVVWVPCVVCRVCVCVCAGGGAGGSTMVRAASAYVVTRTHARTYTHTHTPAGARCRSTAGCSTAHKPGCSTGGQARPRVCCPAQTTSPRPRGSCRCVCVWVGVVCAVCPGGDAYCVLCVCVCVCHAQL